MNQKQPKQEPLTKLEFYTRAKHFTEVNIMAFESLLTDLNLASKDDCRLETTNKEEVIKMLNSFEIKLKQINDEIEKLKAKGEN